jgi:fermentation-respiration switch protein FrsA (DUF1100 family)
MIYTIIRLLVIAGVVYLAAAALLWLLQARFIYYPMRSLAYTPGNIGLAFEDVRLHTGDGVSIHGWYIPAAAEKGVVLFCHGNAGNISHRLDTLQLLHGLGLSTFIFDYRGYGKSTGKPSEVGTYNDAAAAWNYLVTTRRIPPGKIVVFGRSLGGCIAARQAAKDKPGLLILESTFTSVPDMAAKIYPIFPVRLLCRYHYAALEYIKEVRCPVLVIHSSDDEIVPYRFGQMLFEAANEPKAFFEMKGSHNEGFIMSGTEYKTALDTFVKRNL